MNRHELLAALNNHTAVDSLEAQHLKRTVEFVDRYDNCCDRNLRVGHITASSWIVDNDHNHALLTHHKKLNRWLQLGGHVENDRDILNAALREAREESGLNDLHIISDAIFDVDVHPIPARGFEPDHFHFDVRFIFQADRGDTLVISDESHDLRWFTIGELYDELAPDESITRMIDKMKPLKSTR